MWDIVAKKKLNTIRVQNRRPDIDGEYIYACRYWRSNDVSALLKYVFKEVKEIMLNVNISNQLILAVFNVLLPVSLLSSSNL